MRWRRISSVCATTRPPNYDDPLHRDDLAFDEAAVARIEARLKELQRKAAQ
jgi:hypothetical protein